MPQIDPTIPANEENIGGGLGASRIRNLAAATQQMFGGAGTAPITYNIDPFIVDPLTGLSTIPGDPTANLGIASKQYVDQVPQRLDGTTGSTDAYVVTNAIPLTSFKNGTVLLVIWQRTNNTTAPTLNVDGSGPFPIITQSGGSPGIGSLQNGQVDLLVYNLGLASWQLLGMRLGADLGVSYAGPNVIGFAGQPLTAPGSAAGQIYTFNGTGWAPAIPAPAEVGANTTSLAAATIGAGSNAVLYTLATNAPAGPGSWRAIVTFAVNFNPHVNAANGLFTGVLTSNQSGFMSLVGNAIGGFSTLGGQTVSVSGTIFSSTALAASTAVTFTLTGYAPQAQVDVFANPSAGSGGAASNGGIDVMWIQGS